VAEEHLGNQGQNEDLPDPPDVGPPPPLALEAEDQEPEVDLRLPEQVVLTGVSSVEVSYDYEGVYECENHEQTRDPR